MNIQYKTEIEQFQGAQSEQRLIEIINFVIDKLYTQFEFSYYTKDDIRQEAWVMILDAFAKGSYDQNRPIEKFAYRHIKNRLINLRRDKLKNDTSQQSLMNTSEILIDPEDYFVPYHDNISLIEQRIPCYLRSDFLRLLDGVRIPEYKKNKIKRYLYEEEIIN